MGYEKNGGARKGAGRKPKADEDKVRNLAIAAIVAKHGSEATGLKALLDSEEPSLIKFVYEHAYGKPKERHEVSMPEGMAITFKDQTGNKPLPDES